MSTTSSQGSQGGSVFRRVLGVILLIVGVIGVILSIVVLITGIQLFDGLGGAINQVLTLTLDGLSTTRDTLVQTKATIEEVQTSVSNVEKTMVDASMIVEESDAMVDQVFQIVSQDVPDTIDAVHSMIPPAAETTKLLLSDVAKTLDDTGQTVEQTGPLVNQALVIASTFWYLERTPQLMGDIAQRCEAHFGRTQP